MALIVSATEIQELIRASSCAICERYLGEPGPRTPVVRRCAGSCSRPRILTGRPRADWKACTDTCPWGHPRAVCERQSNGHSSYCVFNMRQRAAAKSARNKGLPESEWPVIDLPIKQIPMSERQAARLWAMAND